MYKFCGDIGRGNFSRVKLAVHQLTRDKVAIKVVDRGRLDTRALRMLSREVATLECVHHPNILRLFEVVETLGRVHLVTEWIRGGELYNYITQNGPMKESSAATLYKQLLLAVQHMHNLGFVHRDIKAENVLLVSEDHIKLADFGFSTQLVNGSQQHLDTFCGSPPYAAPELFSDDHYIGGPVDVWALGVLAYFMVVGNMPFRGPTVPSLRSAVLKGDFSISMHLSLPCSRLIQRVLVHTPSRRPSIEQMLASQWVNYPKVPLYLDAVLNMNPNQNQSAKKRHWFSRTRNMRRQAANEHDSRHLEMSNLAPIQCNTKRASSIFAENFLSPIDMPNDDDSQPINHLSNVSLANSSPKAFPKKNFFSSTLKKKIGPIDDPEWGNMCSIRKSPSAGPLRSCELKIETRPPPTANSSDQCNQLVEEKAPFIMLPTMTDDLTVLHQIELEARCILIKFGISNETLLRSIDSGPRSDIIGIYRIIVHRLLQQTLSKKQSELTATPNIVTVIAPKRLGRRCTIL